MTTRILLATALIFVATAKARATEALIFDGGGYNIYILIGTLDKPVVASVRFTPPQAKDWIPVPRELLQVKQFDINKQVLEMHFPRQKDPSLPHSFSLSVRKENAVLSIDGKKIKSSFSWEM